jgi:hypothetical protein
LRKNQRKPKSCDRVGVYINIKHFVMKKKFAIAGFLMAFVVASSFTLNVSPAKSVQPIKMETKARAVVIYEYDGTGSPSLAENWNIAGSVPTCSGTGQYCAFSYNDANDLTKQQAIDAIIAHVAGTTGGLSALTDPFTVTTGTAPNQTVITVYQRAS